MLLSIASALLLIFSFPNFNLSFFAFTGFVPIFFALEKKSKKQAFWIFYLCGVIFYFGVLYWLIHVTLAGLILLVLYLALYFGLFGFIFISLRSEVSCLRSLSIPAIWVLLEYLQSHLLTGFGWALLGYSQFKNLPLIQISDITGVYGVSFVIMMTNVAVYRSFRKSFKEAIVASAVLVAIVGYGMIRENKGEWGRSIKVSVIQGNIPQELKWDPEAQEGILNKYIVLTKMAALDGPDLIIWPETSVPGYWSEYELRDRVLDLVKEIKKPLLIGVITERFNRYFNSAILISKRGEVLGQYDKLHLVPFGEFIPFEKVFPKLRQIISVDIGDFTPGKRFQVFKENLFQFSVLICFEDIFPSLVRQFVKSGAENLVVITNDAWFKKTSAPYQHAAASVFRAIENRRSVIRSTNIGFSCFIEPTGKINGYVKDENGESIFVTGYKTMNVSVSKGLTFYTRFGDVFVGFCGIVCLISFIRRRYVS